MMIAYYSKCQVFAKANKMTINVQGYEMSDRCMLAIVKKKKCQGMYFLAITSVRLQCFWPTAFPDLCQACHLCKIDRNIVDRILQHDHCHATQKTR